MIERTLHYINISLCAFALILTGCVSGLDNGFFTGNNESVGPGDVTLLWKPPTTYVDGTPLDKLTGYRIHYGTEPGKHPNIIYVNNPGASKYVIQESSTEYFIIL